MPEIRSRPDPIAPSKAVGADPDTDREPEAIRPAVARTRKPRRSTRFFAAAAALFMIGAIGWIGLREWDPPMLRDAAAAYRRGDLELAHRQASAHLASRPMSRSAALIAAQSLGLLGRAGEAEPYYRRAGTLGIETLHARALALVQARLHDQAAEVYGEILARAPGDILALRRLAVAHILRSRWAEALEVAGRLKAIPQGEVIGYTLAGVIYHDTDRPESAVVELERVVALDPDLLRMPLEPKEQFWAHLTQDLVQIGRGEEARPFLTRAISQHRNPYFLDLLGETYWQGGESEEAERCWLHSIEIDPRRARPWLALGNLDMQRNRPRQAIERLSRAASLAPTAREPAYALSQSYRRLGQADEAERYRAIADGLRPEIHKPPPGMGEARSR